MKNVLKLLLLLLILSPCSRAQSVTGMWNGWRFVQDSPNVFCTATTWSTCNWTAASGGPIVPTTAGTVWILMVGGNSNFTINSVTGGGGTWVHCLTCHAWNGTWGVDAWYNLTGTAGSASVAVTLSASVSASSINFIEVLPPTGSTASFDTAGAITDSSCTSCAGVGLTLSATDAVVQIPQGTAGTFSGYMTDSNGTGFLLNGTSGAAPTFTLLPGRSAASPAITALAFKSSLGSFTPPTPQYSYQFTANGSCATASCTIPFTSPIDGSTWTTQAGDLMVVTAYGGAAITSAPSGWVVPSGGCKVGPLSCAYSLSVAGGLNSITLTMGGSGGHNFAVYDFRSNTGGSWSLDAQNNFTDTTGYDSGYLNNGPSLTTTGANDVVVQTLKCGGGSNGPSWYPLPSPIPKSTPEFVGPYNYFYINQTASVALTDSGPIVQTPVWYNCPDLINHAAPTYASALAFTAGSGSPRPNPPTGLNAVVN